MPDANGMPTGIEVLTKIRVSAPGDVPASLANDLGFVIGEVVARLQSPALYDGSGGTGRQFVPTTETRLFDGAGYRELIVDDIVPGTPITVSAFGIPLAAVSLREGTRGRGYNVLALASGDYWVGGFGSGFPRGVQNIAVTATWGYAAVVPFDVYEAVRCESAYRALIGGFVPLSGVGEEVTIDGFSINTSAGISVWRESSPITMLHQTYTDCVRRYELPTARAVHRYAQAQRMS